MLAAVLFVGRGRTAHSLSIPQPARTEVRGEMANLLTTSLTTDQFGVNDSCAVCFTDCLDPLLPTELFRPFLKRFVLIATDASCHSRARIHKNAHMFVASAAKWLVLWSN